MSSQNVLANNYFYHLQQQAMQQSQMTQNQHGLTGILGQYTGRIPYTAADIAQAFHTNTSSTKEKGETTVIKSLKDYYAKHQEIIITIIAALALDHFLFEGKFGHKLEAIMESLIGKLESKVKESVTK